MKIKYYIIIAVVIAACAAVSTIRFSKLELRHEFKPINLNDTSSQEQEFKCRFDGRDLVLSVKRSNNDKDLKGKDGIVFTVRKWERGTWVDTQLLDPNGKVFTIKTIAQIENGNGKTREY